MALGDEATLDDRLLDVLSGHPSELAKTALWNAGFYLWQGGVAESLSAGLGEAQTLIGKGKALAKLEELRQHCAELSQCLTHSRS